MRSYCTDECAMMPKSVAIIGTVGVPAKYGGFETLADQLIRHLHGNYAFTVYCSSLSYPSRADDFNGAKLVYLPFNANGMQSTVYDIAAISHALPRADTLLILGVSGCIILPIVRLLSRKKIIAHIDGMEWQRAKWNWFAKAFLRLSERLAVKFADVVIADNAAIKRYVYKEYHRDSVLIAYGGDHAEAQPDIKDFREEFAFLGRKYAFGICRIEPENNVHSVLETFSAVDGLPLVMVGNWDNSDYGRALKAKYRDVANIHVIDAIYDQRKLDALRSNCSLYIHGHSAGGTNPSLVEAMNLGLPIVAFDVPYNRETTENKAIYFKNANELANVVQSRDTLALDKVARDMSAIAQRAYQWETIAQKYSELF